MAEYDTVLDDDLNNMTPENKAFIVRAVNAHEELLEALKLAYRALRDPGQRHQFTDGRGLTEGIVSAIAKAEGKPS